MTLTHHPLYVCGLVCACPGYKRHSAAKRGKLGSADTPEWKKYIRYDCARQIALSVVKQHSLFRNKLVTSCLVVH